MIAKKIPNWIKELDDDSADKELLTQIARTSKRPIETPREFNFMITKFKSQEDAENAGYYIQQQGWICKVGIDSNMLYWLEATKNFYVIDKNQLFIDEAEFVRIATQYGATYDGWYAEEV